MDIDVTLAALRRSVAETLSGEADTYEIAELFDALDGWLSRGGYLPNGWTAFKTESPATGSHPATESPESPGGWVVLGSPAIGSPGGWVESPAASPAASPATGSPAASPATGSPATGSPETLSEICQDIERLLRPMH